MKNYYKIFYLGDPYFHIIGSDGNDFKELSGFLETELPMKAFLVIMDLSGISKDEQLFNIFLSNFHFPDYFGHNWNAFDECMTDLSWIKSGSYILVLQNFDRMQSDIEGKELLVRSLVFITKEWRNGMYYDDFPNPPTPFHVIFAAKENAIDGLKEFLRSNGIENIGTFEEMKYE